LQQEETGRRESTFHAGYIIDDGGIPFGFQTMLDQGNLMDYPGFRGGGCRNSPDF
jgi:hypothetical protein